MGVHGLWHLLQPTGRPVSLQSLEGKVLAVDVSIWLHQAVKGMRNKDGSPISNAHLHVLFTRVCKLLYYKIKPVFVFDGRVPELKKQTMASRREKKMIAEVEGDKASKKILDNLLKSHALKEVMKKGHASTDSSSSVSQPSTSSQSQQSAQKPDLFQLPPLPEEFARAQEIQPWEEPTTNATIFEDEYQNLDDVDIDSAEFKSLPAEVQHEILSELRERRKRLTRYSNLKLPKDSNDFSSFQMAKLLKQNDLSNKLEEVRMKMTKQISGEITQDLGEHAVGTEIQAQRILSDDSSHFILIKGLSNKRKLEELDKIKEEAEREEESEMEDLKNGERIVEDDKVMIDLGESDSESETCDSYKKNEHSKDMSNNVESQISRFTVDEPMEKSIGCSSKSHKPFGDSYQEKENAVSEGSSNFNRGQERTGEHVKHDKDIEIIGTSSDVSKCKNENSIENDKTKTIKSLPREANLSDDNSKAYEIHEKNDKGSVNPLAQNVDRKSSNHDRSESSDSEDEGFIEVSIDPAKIGPDELFPADIFTTASTEVEEIPIVSANKEEQLVEEPCGSAERELSPEPEYTQLAEPERIPTEISSESPNDLVKQFTELVENDVDRVYEDLEVETRALQQERGRQERLAASLSDQMYLEAQDLLKLFGVPFVLSPTEAEAQCAWLDSANLTNGTITDDSDIWLFGGRRVYKNFFNQDRTVELFMNDSIQSQLGLNREILINMALLCGSDYTDGIAGVGPVTAMEILSEFPAADFSALQAFKSWWEETQKHKRNPKISKIRSKLRQLEVSEGFPDHRIVDAYLKPTVDDSKEAFSWALPDLDLLREYAKEKLGWAQVKTDEVLLPVLQKLKETQVQTRINSYFQPENFMEPKKLKSVRLKRALKKFHDSPEKKQTGSQEDSEFKSKETESVDEKTKRARVVKNLAAKQYTESNKSNSRPRGKGSRAPRGRGKGKAPAKKVETMRKPVYKEEVNLSESSSDDQGDGVANDDDDDMLANLDYESWQK